jgi:hypothetical protein
MYNATFFSITKTSQRTVNSRGYERKNRGRKEEDSDAEQTVVPLVFEATLSRVEDLVIWYTNTPPFGIEEAPRRQGSKRL